MFFIQNTYYFLTIIALGMIIGGGLFLFFERKLIAIGQKRLGISFIGRHGWLHIVADVVKFWSKQTSKNFPLNQSSSLSLLGGFIVWSILCSIFFLTNTSSIAINFEFNLFLYLTYNLITLIYTIYIISLLKSKYSNLACLRLVLLNIFFEIPMTILFFFVYTIGGDYTFEIFYNLEYNLFFVSLPIVFLLFIFSIFETKRAPFDHTEAESELVAGHLIEFGGRTWLLFFICEYIHVYFCLYFLVLVFFGFNSINFFKFFLIFFN